MDYKSLTLLLLRLTGVIILAIALIQAPNTFGILIFSSVSGRGDAATWLLTATSGTVPILIGLLLIYFPATIANRIVSGDGETADFHRLEQVAFSTVGLWFVARATFDVVYWFAMLRLYPLIFHPELSNRPTHLTDDQFADIVTTCFKLVAGIALLFGGRGLANIVHRLRTPPALPEMPSPMQDVPAGRPHG